VSAFDPEAHHEASKLYPESERFRLAVDLYSCLEDADALVLVTEWKVFWSPDLARVKRLLRSPVIIDGRNVYDPSLIESQGIAYYGIGRGRSVRGAGHAA
jgi:UDPglucose 6-dehydrogenase